MKNKGMNDIVNDVKKEYFKNWRKNNKDKIKEYNSRYWQKKADNIKNEMTK